MSIIVNDIPVGLGEESDPEIAAEILLKIVRYLRSGKPVPKNAADYLANAIEAAMAKPKEKRASALAHELNLKALNRRPIFIDPDWLYDYIYKDLSETRAKNLIAKKYNISPSLALKFFKIAKMQWEIETEQNSQI